MTDAAERWLRENDPDYAESRKGWKHLRGEDCPPPAQEIPWGDDLEDAVVSVADVLCGRCGAPFTPTTSWQKYCSDKCRQRAFHRKRVTHS